MKKFCFAVLLAGGYFAEAQTIGNSPYAAFGLGDVKYDNTLDHHAMGGISTAFVNDFNNKFNFQNPAANQNLELATFSMGVANENTMYKSESAEDVTKHSTYFSNISLAFPLSPKLKFGAGFQPYSTKNYSLVQTGKLADDVVQANRFSGDGSVNTAQAALGYSIGKGVSLGIRSNYYFGTVNDLQEVTFTGAELINGYRTKNKVSAFSVTGGATWQQTVAEDYKLTVGASYTTEPSGDSKTTILNSTYYYVGNDVAGEQLISQKTVKGKTAIPSEFSVGIGYGRDGRWFASTQADFRQMPDIEVSGLNYQHRDGYRFSLGGWYLPNYNNFRNYFSRVTYRFGGFYEKGNLKLQVDNAPAKGVDSFGASLGMTLPFANTNINRQSSMDIALEAGKRGTTSNGLIQETFINFRVAINFADRWFQKRQYD
ncbi:hypothetical protein SAMN05443429_10251 [Cruoricaptor ignavus]|uniref:Long-chain fatty acid transport protein n=1 Tax=Cruoricaptor ignavus TaxID=1118202 RepID=A0A1M6BLW2_9FLAO|nr:hypothetical protein [Cruoricaptor ignavus]SHI49656.1 hypothetical protein SAMN05443429_10251 [Cruoricaptor ignavus]